MQLKIAINLTQTGLFPDTIPLFRQTLKGPQLINYSRYLVEKMACEVPLFIENLETIIRTPPGPNVFSNHNQTLRQSGAASGHVTHNGLCPERACRTASRDRTCKRINSTTQIHPILRFAYFRIRFSPQHPNRLPKQSERIPISYRMRV